MAEKNQMIWIVTQTQPDEGYHETAIYACSTEEKATEYARKLNKEYGAGCIFDENWDFEEVDYDGGYDEENGVSYYEVQPLKVDEPLA